MAITVHEKWESRESIKGENPSIDRVYIIRGTADDLEAKRALKDEAPKSYDGLARQSWRIERLAEDIWKGTVQYGKGESPEEREFSLQFDTGGGTHHITQSLETVGVYDLPGMPAPDFQGAIGVTHDNVEGVDITVPVFNFSETYRFPQLQIGYVKTLFQLTGTVNADPFRSFEPGEVLFLGASGSKRSKDEWEVTYKFAASPNVRGLTIGEIENIDKDGWDYLWVRYADYKDEKAHVIIKKPVAVYVEQVYRYADFSALGISRRIVHE